MRRAAIADEDLFTPVERQRVSSIVADRLQRAILSGSLREGDRLPPERDLVERFQASRASVQEALHILEIVGFVTIRRGASGGAFVARPDFSRVSSMLQALLMADSFEFDDLYQARLLIEPSIAEMVAQVATPDDIAGLAELIAPANREAAARDDLPGGLGRNFHYLLASITGNQPLVMLVSSLLGLAQAAGLRQPKNALNERIKAQTVILDAIARRDGAEARRLMTELLHEMLRAATRVEG